VIVWDGSIRALPASWLIWDRFVPSLEQTIVVGVGDGWQRPRRRSQSGCRCRQSTSDCRCWTVVWAVRSRTRHLAAAEGGSRDAQRCKCDLRCRGSHCKSAEAQQKTCVGLHLVDRNGGDGRVAREKGRTSFSALEFFSQIYPSATELFSAGDDLNPYRKRPATPSTSVQMVEAGKMRVESLECISVTQPRRSPCYSARCIRNRAMHLSWPRRISMSGPKVRVRGP
jgi:hypothetical protein